MEFEMNNSDIDESKLKKIEFRVYWLEKENFVNKKMKDNQIVDSIIKIIDSEVQNDN